MRYAERRALESTLRSLKTSLGELSQLEYYQERRLRSLNLTPIETVESRWGTNNRGEALETGVEPSPKWRESA